MERLQTRATAALAAVFVPDSEWILVIHAQPRSSRHAVTASALSPVGELGAPCEIDLRALHRRPPRAVVVEARDPLADLAGTIDHLVDAGLSGVVPTLLAAPLEVLGDVDEAAVDDVVVYPYTVAELGARVRRIERRWRERAGDRALRVGGLHIDTASHRVALDDRTVALTRLEYALLRFFVQNPGRVYTRDELLTRVWGAGGSAGSRTVDIHVRRLRAKLGDGIAALETVRGVGYRFMTPPASRLQ